MVVLFSEYRLEVSRGKGPAGCLGRGRVGYLVGAGPRKQKAA